MIFRYLLFGCTFAGLIIFAGLPAAAQPAPHHASQPSSHSTLDVPEIFSGQQITLPTVLCGTTQLDTIMIFNIGDGTLEIFSAAFVIASANFALVSPAAFPVMIAPGDSLQCVIAFMPSAVGTSAALFSLINSDPLPGDSPWQITITGNKDSVSIGVFGVLNDTLNFGNFSCGSSKDSSIELYNLSTVSTTCAAQTGNTGVFSATKTISLGVNQLKTIAVHFSGGSLPGKIIDSMSITDTCGKKSVVYLAATVVSPAFVNTSVPDTTVCPGIAVSRTATIRNLSQATLGVQISAAGIAWTVSPAVTAIRGGGTATVNIIFNGAAQVGDYSTVITMVDACGGTNSFSSIVHVDVPEIVVPQAFTFATCPGEAFQVPLPVTNRDSAEHTLMYASPSCVLSHQSATLGIGMTDTLQAVFSPLAPGTYQHSIDVTDDCSNTHEISFTVIVRYRSAITFSLHADTARAAIGAERKAYVIASPIAALAGPYTLSIMNEPTALHFDHLVSTYTISATPADNILTITLSQTTTIVSDTVATIFYQTLVGSTLTPTVRLSNVADSDACQDISGAGEDTIALAPAGCELGTVLVQPFITSLDEIFPNPAAGASTLHYSLRDAGSVLIQLHDALGRTVRIIANTTQSPGAYQTSIDVKNLNTGVYFVEMYSGAFALRREMMVVR